MVIGASAQDVGGWLTGGVPKYIRVVLGGALVSLILANCGAPSSTVSKATTSQLVTSQPPTSYSTTTTVGRVSTATTVSTASTNPAPTCDSPSNTTVYDGNGLRFERPTCWTPVHNNEVSTFSSSLVDLSNEPMQDPCMTTRYSSACGWPLTNLVTRWGPGSLEFKRLPRVESPTSARHVGDRWWSACPRTSQPARALQLDWC
jgi:hypothetical protein